MDPDNRGRLSGPSASKKRKFGRYKSVKKRSLNFQKSKPTEPTENLSQSMTELNLAVPLTSSVSTSTASVTLNENDQPSSPVVHEIVSETRASRSAAKLSTSSDIDSDPINESCYRIIDINLLFPQLETVLVCAKCFASVKLSESSVRGLGFKINVSCSSCDSVTAIDSSQQIGKKNNVYEINRRSVLAARTIGQGLIGLKTFCGVMDLPPPVQHSTYDKIIKHLENASEVVALKSMEQAVKEEFEGKATGESMSVFGDGSWRKRGFSSLQGISRLIRFETGKLIDVSIKHSFCKACQEQEDQKDTAEYNEWYAQHQDSCTANHAGSAGKMEGDGILEMFQRSVDRYGVYYENYIGDGDSKVFHAVCNDQPYGQDIIVNKKECVGHVQKRMGTRLRTLKKSYSKRKLSDGKTIGGKGRLTANVIDKLTQYYGNAIRAHSTSSIDMANAIWATYYHYSSSNEDPQHHLCPDGETSWCKWQKAKAQGALQEYHHQSSLPSSVMEVIKPIYEELTKEDLLQRCVGGFTQNSNESFNNVVWKFLPKSSFSGLSVLKIGTYMAVICFNDGKAGFLKLLNKFKVKPGVAAIQWAENADKERIFRAETRAATATLESRQAQRKRQYPEDNSYIPGGY